MQYKNYYLCCLTYFLLYNLILIIFGDIMSNLPWGTSKVLTDEEFFNKTQEIINLTNLLNPTCENNAQDILVTGI